MLFMIVCYYALLNRCVVVSIMSFRDRDGSFQNSRPVSKISGKVCGSWLALSDSLNVHLNLLIYCSGLILKIKRFAAKFLEKRVLMGVNDCVLLKGRVVDTWKGTYRTSYAHLNLLLFISGATGVVGEKPSRAKAFFLSPLRKNRTRTYS